MWACLALCVLAPAVYAFDSEEAWKNLVIQAQYAVGKNELSQAEKLYLTAVKEAEHFGGQDARLGTTLTSLGAVYASQRKTNEAIATFNRAISILQNSNGPESLEVAEVYMDLANALRDEGKHPAAIGYLNKTLQIYQGLLGGNNVKTAQALCGLGDSYRAMRDFPNATASYRHCADIREEDGGILNADLAEALRGLALSYVGEGKTGPADGVFRLAERIMERTSGKSNPQFGKMLEDHIALLKRMDDRAKDVEKLQDLAQSLRQTAAKKP